MVIPSLSCFFFFFVSLIFQALASPTLQRDALLEFKNEFPLVARDALSYGPLTSWNTSSDHCSWEGVTCNAKSGEVISLFLDTISLNGSLKSNSSLFKLQHLRHLTLISCDLKGEIPSSLGNLSHLTYLDLLNNHLVGEIPSSLGNLSHLVHLDLSINNLVGGIPCFISNLQKLSFLSLSSNNLAGKIPSSLGNLNQLNSLSLSSNNLSGNIPTSIANLTKLSVLYLSQNKFTGRDFPRILPNLTSLSELYLYDNHIKSKLPSDMSGLHNLERFDVSENSFFGKVPISLFRIPSLEFLHLEVNQFEGPLEFRNRRNTSYSLDMLSIDLSHNSFHGLVPESIYGCLNIRRIDLSHNSFSKLGSPTSSKLGSLSFLNLSYNKLVGQVPSILWGLRILVLSHNSFSSLERPLEVAVDGSRYDIGYNSLQGTFPSWICKFTKLLTLDLSNNYLSGSISPCLKNSTTTLLVLNLRNNNLSGILPDIFVNATLLGSLDVSHNQLVGNLPKSLINCSRLQFLNLKGNKIKDMFPSWLQSLGHLHVLLLGSNAFHGPIYSSSTDLGFPALRILDISHNSFSGTLPPDYFSNWLEMSLVLEADTESSNVAEYFGVYDSSNINEVSMDMMYKGAETEFSRIFLAYEAIDFSGNNFTGRIPRSIGMLKGLRLLNLSGNAFKGNIPSSLANITILEALDLSRNKLSGQIPHDLGNLSFLSYLDFSHNFLEGPVPRSTQFQRQNCSSFEDNRGLIGLEEICGDIHVPDAGPPQPKEVSSEPEEVISWTAAAITYVPGVFCGLVIGHIFFPSHKLGWFMEKFGRKQPTGITSVR